MRECLHAGLDGSRYVRVCECKSRPIVTIALLTKHEGRKGEEKSELEGALIVERKSMRIGGGEAIGEKE